MRKESRMALRFLGLATDRFACSGSLRTFPVVAVKVLHPENSLSPQQTWIVGYPSNLCFAAETKVLQPPEALSRVDFCRKTRSPSLDMLGLSSLLYF